MPAPEVLGGFHTSGGTRYLRVTSGGAGAADLVKEYRAGAYVCLRSECLGASKARRCAHVSAARAYLAAVDSAPSGGPSDAPVLERAA